MSEKKLVILAPHFILRVTTKYRTILATFKAELCLSYLQKL